MNRAEAVAQLKEVWSILTEDLNLAEEYWQIEKTAYAKRALIRAFFAAVEGLSYQLRQVTLATLENTEFITTAELALLKEERYDLDDKGRAKTKENYLPFHKSFLFSISSYAKNHGVTFEVDKSQPGWQAMQDTIRARNNVTHPKSPKSLMLSDADLKDLMEASQWWQATLLSLFKACEEADVRFTMLEAGK